MKAKRQMEKFSTYPIVHALRKKHVPVLTMIKKEERKLLIKIPSGSWKIKWQNVLAFCFLCAILQSRAGLSGERKKVNRSKGKGNAVWICGSPCCCKGDEWSITIGESWEGRPGGWPRARRPPLWFWDVSVSMEDWCMFQRDGWRSIWRLFWFCVSGKFFQALFYYH